LEGGSCHANSRDRICLLIIVQLTIVADFPYVAYSYKQIYLGSGPGRLPVLGWSSFGASVGKGYGQSEKEVNMLWTIAVVLIILWMLGLVTGYTMGYFIHILLVIAIIVVLVRVIQGRKPL
jgi:hypothetical protein